MRIRAAAAAWRIRPLRSDARFFGHMHDLVSQAYDEGARLLVLPELFSLELLGLEPSLPAPKAPRYLVQYASAIEEWLARIARNSGLVIVGGSHFREEADGIANVCPIALPSGETILQRKNNLTAYEREVWELVGGTELRRLPAPLGALVCYDSEFPEAGRVLAEAGTEVLAVPSWTETRRGFQRVRWSCLARAIENGIFVLHASLLGELGGEPVPETYGSAAVIAPSAEPFLAEAILRETELGVEGLAIADLDLDLLAECRASAEVRNWADRRRSPWTLVAGGEERPLLPPDPPRSVEAELAD